MTEIRSSALLLAALTLCAAGTVPAQEKLEFGPLLNVNGGFEDGKGHFYFTKPTLDLIDNDEVYRGAASLRSQGEGKTENGEANIAVQGYSIPAPGPNTFYIFRVAVKAKNVDPKFPPSVQFRRETADKKVTTISPEAGVIRQDTDWKVIEIKSDALPADTKTLAFWLHNPAQSKATVWFDEIEIRPISNPPAGGFAPVASPVTPAVAQPAKVAPPADTARQGYGPVINLNGGFEQGKAFYHPTRPDFMSLDPQNPYKGTQSVRLQGPNAPTGENNILVQGFPVPLPKPNTRYSIRFAVKAQNVDAANPPSVQVFGTEGPGKPRIVFPESRDLVIKADTDWKVMETEVGNLPPGMVTLAFWLVVPVQSKATVWFDEIEIRENLKPQVAAIAPVTTTAAAAIKPNSATVGTAGWQLGLNHENLSLYERGEAAFAGLKWQGNGSAATPPAFALYDQRDQKIRDLTAQPDGDGWRISLPSDRLGYFELRPQVEDAAAVIPAQGSRPAGKLTFAVVEKINRDPARGFKSAFLASQGTTIIAPRDGQAFGWDALPYLGVQSQGASYQWQNWEADGPGTFEQNIGRDKQPKWFKELGMVPYFQLNGVPMWAADASRLPEKERGSKATQRIPPKDWAQWEAYLEKVVPYIAKNYDYLPEHVYEVMWEPVIPWGWYGTPEEIVKNFEVAAPVIKKYDPKGRIAGPTLSGLNDTSIYETYLKAGLGKYLDMVAFHPYKGYPPEKNAIPEALRNIRDVTKKYTNRDLPFIGTEFGFPQHTTGSALNQGYGLATSILIFKGEGARKHTLFYMADYAGEPGYGMNYNLVSGLPFGPARISPKPGVPMIRAAIDQVGDAEPVGKLDYFGSDIWGYVFKENSDGTLFAAIWDASDKDRTVTFEAGVPKVELVDGFGNRQTLATKDGRLTLGLKRSPTYVRGISAQLYGPGKIAPLVQTDEVWRVYRGRKATFNLGFSRPLGTGEAGLTFDTAADVSADQVRQNVSVKPGSKATVSFDVAPNAPLGPAAGYLRLREGDNTLYRGVQRIEVVPDLEVGRPRVRRLNGQWQAVSAVKNLAPFNWSGSAVLTLGDKALAPQKVTLLAGANQEVSWPVAATNPTSTIAAGLELKGATGPALTRDGRLSFFEIQKKPAGADFWSTLQSVGIKPGPDNSWKQHPDSELKGEADLSAKFAYAYDKDNLYVQAVVRDDVHRQEASAGTTWSQDSLQLAFDVVPGRSENANLVAEGFERTRSEWCMAFTSRGPEIFVHMVPGGSSLAEGALVKFPGAKLEGGREGDLTTYRLTIPWKMLDPKSVRDPKQLGLAAAINDSDVDTKFGDRRGIELFGGILRTKNPAEFGVGQLEN